MKKSLYILFLILFSTFNVSANPLEDLRDQLRNYPRSLTIAEAAIEPDAIYTPKVINWPQHFNLRDEAEHKEAEALRDALVKYFEPQITEKYRVRSTLTPGTHDPEYGTLCKYRTLIVDSFNDAYSTVIGGTDLNLFEREYLRQYDLLVLDAQDELGDSEEESDEEEGL